MGTTSACAENTAGIARPVLDPRNYLRVRGEYGLLIVGTPLPWELPPRARRIPMEIPQGDHWLGNYLRVRGEYFCRVFEGVPSGELPPRARRILDVDLYLPRRMGTTSACAENTCLRPVGPAASGNYLRVRGEYYRGTPLGW